jgi:hypothetical protein
MDDICRRTDRLTPPPPPRRRHLLHTQEAALALIAAALLHAPPEPGPTARSAFGAAEADPAADSAAAAEAAEAAEAEVAAEATLGPEPVVSPGFMDRLARVCLGRLLAVAACLPSVPADAGPAAAAAGGGPAGGGLGEPDGLGGGRPFLVTFEAFAQVGGGALRSCVRACVRVRACVCG